MLLKKKGITLIALVVTIIILLILTAVTIALLFGENGIIIKAKQSEVEGRAATLRDKVSVWHAENNIKSKTGEEIKTIEAFTTELRGQGLLENDDEVNDILADRILVLATEEKDKFRVEVDFSGWKSPKIGDIVIYDPREGATSEQLTYTSPVGSALAGANVSGNGYSEQIFTVNENDTEWIVIGKENGQLKLMSKEVKIPKYPVTVDGKTGFALRYGQGWLYAEEELHKICSIYGYGKGADKSKITTYEIGNPEITGELQIKTLEGSGARSITIQDLQELTNYPLTISRDTASTDNPIVDVYVPSLNGVNTEGRCHDSNKLSHLPHMHKITNKEEFNNNLKTGYERLIGKVFKNKSSWLASRCIYSYSQTQQNFMIEVLATETVSGASTCAGYSDKYNSISRVSTICPVVYLKSGIQLNELESGKWELVK